MLFTTHCLICLKKLLIKNSCIKHDENSTKPKRGVDKLVNNKRSDAIVNHRFEIIKKKKIQSLVRLGTFTRLRMRLLDYLNVNDAKYKP